MSGPSNTGRVVLQHRFFLMQFSGEIYVAAPRAAVFAKLRDAEFFASCIEGIGALEQQDATHFTAVLQTRIAYIRFSFHVGVEILREEPPDLVEARVEGVPSGIVGRLTATSSATLREEGAGTMISYVMEAALTGRLGSLGQPVMKAKAREMEKQFSANLQQAFAAQDQGAAS